MNVHIRQKKSPTSDKVALALEIYKGYSKTEDGKIKANRKTEKLDYYLFANPKSPSQKLHNKEVLRKVEALKGEVLKNLLNGKYGFQSDTNNRANFIEYVQKLTNERHESSGNYGNWDSALKHLKKYRGENYSFENVDVEFCEGFKDYLVNKAKTKNNQSLSSASASSYFCKLRAALNQAVDDGIILTNPCLKVSLPRIKENTREFLTLDEVKLIYKAECKYDVLKRAFLFSCLTGLRWSDIQTLEWSQLQKENETWKIVFHQKKTKGLQYHYINEEAHKLLGTKTEGTNRVFVGLSYSDYFNTALLRWMMKAGITKHITFHCARHTFATLQLTLGTDLFTVSKMLGHSEIRTTQIYAKVIDQKKIDAVNIIPNILID